MDLSYAQRLEDYHLACAFAGQPGGFYVDIGAGHPVADNVSFWFYLQGWSGLVVEPQEQLLALYRHVRPRDIASGSLVGREVGDTAFHIVKGLHGLSSTVEQNARQAAAFGAAYSTVRRPVTTLSELCAQHDVECIDFLKVDVEGAEADVLAGADWSRWRPRIVVGEAIAPNGAAESWREWDAILLAQNYVFILFDGLNRFYVAAEETKLATLLPRAPAPWGLTRHLYEFGRAHENPAHPDHALAKRLVQAFLIALAAEDDGSFMAPRRASLAADCKASTAHRIQGFLAGLPMLDEKQLMSLLQASGPADEGALRACLRDDAFRAALGRIAAPFDGGLTLDDEAPGDADAPSDEPAA
jgi:FkbM family methyltransferase